MGSIFPELSRITFEVSNFTCVPSDVFVKIVRFEHLLHNVNRGSLADFTADWVRAGKLAEFP